MPIVLMSTKRPPVRSTFVQHVYTRAEILTLINAIPRSQSNAECLLHHQTFRSVLLFLYRTGAGISEVSQLALRHVDVKKSCTISNPALNEPVEFRAVQN